MIGVIRVTNAMLPWLRRSAAPRIVNMSSSVGSPTLQTPAGAETGPIAAAYSPLRSRSMINVRRRLQYAEELRDTSILINAGLPRVRRDRPPARDAAGRRPDRRVPFDDAGVVPW